MDIHAVLAINPRSVRFGRLKKGTPYPVKYASLVGDQKDDVRILSAKSKNEYLTVETGSFKTENDKEYQVRITVLPEIGLGRFGDQITLETDHKRIKRLKLYVSGQITGNIILNTSHVNFGTFRAGGRYARNISLTAAKDVVFKVLDVQTTVAGLHTKLLTLEDGKAYRITATIGEDFCEDTLSGKILITTDDKAQHLIEVSVFGRAFQSKNFESSHNRAVPK